MRAFLAEWQAAVGDSVKPSTRQNYADYIRAYVDPIIGDRRLQDITVPVLSDRIGHAHEGITVAIYGHRSTGHDRDAAELVAGLIRRRLDTEPEAG